VPVTYRKGVSADALATKRVVQLPPTGPGSAGGLGRRSAALIIDWTACLAVASLLSGGLANDRARSLTMVIFFLEVTLFTWLLGASFGQRILRLVVAPVARPRLTLLRSAVRTALLCLVIPAVVMQPDGRGLHDLAAGSIVIRR
jgi:uncharacterized RDD family membrane protein YckC